MKRINTRSQTVKKGKKIKIEKEENESNDEESDNENSDFSLENEEETKSDKDFVVKDDDVEDDDDILYSLSDKIDVDKEKKNLGPEMKEELDKVIKYTEEEYPNLEKIFRKEFTTNEKAELLHLYEAWKEAEPSTSDWFNFKKELFEKLEMCNRNVKERNLFTKEQQLEMNRKLQDLEEKNIRTPLIQQIANLNTTDKIKSIIYTEYKRWKNMDDSNDEKSKLDKWLQTVLSIPFNKYKDINLKENFINYVKEKLDEHFYGMEKVKEELLVYLNTKINSPKSGSLNCLGLIGPPGVGKTAIVNFLRDVLELPLASISCGGINTSETLKGNLYTWIGATHGDILRAVIAAEYLNCICFLDEFDKMSENPAIMAIMLHILDPVQNSRYHDDFIGTDIDIPLSDVLWILSLNNNENINKALSDRIYYIHLEGYKIEEKKQILLKHFFPKTLRTLGFENKANQNEKLVTLTPDVAEFLINQVSNEKDEGVRQIEHAVKVLLQRLLFLKNTKNIKPSFYIENLLFPLNLQKNHISNLLKGCKFKEEISINKSMMYT